MNILSVSNPPAPPTHTPAPYPPKVPPVLTRQRLFRRPTKASTSDCSNQNFEIWDSPF